MSLWRDGTQHSKPMVDTDTGDMTYAERQKELYPTNEWHRRFIDAVSKGGKQ